MKLTQLYLSNDVPASFHFNRPGAVHKARWMSKLIYCLKMVMLMNKIQSESNTVIVFGRGQASKLERFVKFVVFCYVGWWFTAPLAAYAPMNDLKFLKDIESYRAIDSEIADAAIGAFENHTWYLNEEIIPMATFASGIPDSIKASIAKNIKESTSTRVARFGTGYGKPIFPEIPKPISDVSLSDFVGPNSKNFFKITKIDMSFLDKPVEEWEHDEKYVEAKTIVANFSVVNDASERGVKLANDYLHSAKTETTYQSITQVVENHRNTVSNQRNRKIESKKWHLKL